MVIHVNQTYCGDHFIIHENMESLCCIRKVNIMLYVNYTSIKKIIWRHPFSTLGFDFLISFKFSPLLMNSRSEMTQAINFSPKATFLYYPFFSLKHMRINLLKIYILKVRNLSSIALTTEFQ